MSRTDRIVKLSTVAVNLAILAALVFIVAAPGGFVRQKLSAWNAARELRAAVSESWDELIADTEPGIPVLVEFTDYQCPFCTQMADTLSHAKKQARLQVVTLHYPIRPIHPRAEAAARAAICAERQGRFAAMHEYLFSTSTWHDQAVGWDAAIAASAIPDVEAFTNCLGSAETTARLARDSALAVRWGVRSTPTFISPGGVRRGVLSREELISLAQP